MVFLVFLIAFLLIPSLAFAWGPLTHAYLANEIFSFAPLVPAGILAILRKYRQDFVYGNVMADMVLGKKYLPGEKSSHNWEVGLKLLEQAKRGPERAFIYGFLCHLAADTVAHELLIEDRKDVGHTWLEMKADSIIDKVYWLQTIMISRAVQKRNDEFLENSLDSFIFSPRTNKRIYKGIVFLCLLNKKRTGGLNKRFLRRLHKESLERMLDLLNNVKTAKVLAKDPLPIK